MREYGTPIRSHSQEPSGTRSRSREPSSEVRPGPPRHDHSWHHTMQHTSTDRDRYGTLRAGAAGAQRLVPLRAAPPPPAKRTPAHTRSNSRDDDKHTRSSPRDDRRVVNIPPRPVPQKAATMPSPMHREPVRTPLLTKSTSTHAQMYNLPSPKLASVSAKLNENRLREYEYSHPLPPTPVSRYSSQHSGPPPSASSLARKEAISRSGRHSRSSNRM